MVQLKLITCEVSSSVVSVLLVAAGTGRIILVPLIRIIASSGFSEEMGKRHNLCRPK